MRKKEKKELLQVKLRRMEELLQAAKMNVGYDSARVELNLTEALKEIEVLAASLKLDTYKETADELIDMFLNTKIKK